MDAESSDPALRMPVRWAEVDGLADLQLVSIRRAGLVQERPARIWLALPVPDLVLTLPHDQGGQPATTASALRSLLRKGASAILTDPPRIGWRAARLNC
jgi:hypothetical protein